MRRREIGKRCLSGVLAMGLLLGLALPVRGEETNPETTTATEESTVQETTREETCPETIPATQPETRPEDTQPEEILPEDTQPQQTLPEAAVYSGRVLEPDICSIAQAAKLPSGTENITIQGTVVYVGGYVVLEDDSGGIRVSFGTVPEVALGDDLQVTGNRSGGFYATDWKRIGASELPAREATIANAPENVRVHITDACLDGGQLRQGESTITLKGELPSGAVDGAQVSVFGVVMDGILYADRVDVTGSVSASTGETADYHPYFGQLHAHSTLSSGEDSVETLFAFAKEAGLDFFAVTDHSDSFDKAEEGGLTKDGTAISDDWKQGREAAEEATGADFLGLYGFELSWPSGLHLGHISTFLTPGWQSWKDFDTLEEYYRVLRKVPQSVSQFNHPGPYNGEFENFSGYSEAYDAQMYLLEVGSEENGTSQRYDAYYHKALDQGWHLAPANSSNLHDTEDGIGTGRTVVLAEELTEESLFAAIRANRVYASEDDDLEIDYRLNGAVMGSRLEDCEETVLTLYMVDPTDDTDDMVGETGKVEVIVDGGEVAAEREITTASANLTFDIPGAYRYYYLRITQPDGDIALTAPVWVERQPEWNVSVSSSAVEPVQNETVNLKLTLENGDKTKLQLEKITIFEDSSSGDILWSQEVNKTLGKGETDAYSCSIKVPTKCRESGSLKLLARVTVTANGTAQTQEQELSLTVARQSYEARTLEISSLSELRTKGEAGQRYRIQGYVTAGTSNAYTTFPDTVYVQDETGGIAVKPFAEVGIAIGTPMDITGTLVWEDGNAVLVPEGYEILETDAYRYSPKTLSNETATNYELLGGSLVQVEGKVVSLKYTADSKGIAQIQLKDVVGDLATVVIEDAIRSGTTGKNELAGQVKVGRTVRVIGLLHRTGTGESVIRVRNCDEVVYVVPKADSTNPKTGDVLGHLLAFPNS